MSPGAAKHKYEKLLWSLTHCKLGLNISMLIDGLHNYFIIYWSIKHGAVINKW
jgi:hypothetical protein